MKTKICLTGHVSCCGYWLVPSPSEPARHSGGERHADLNRRRRTEQGEKQQEERRDL